MVLMYGNTQPNLPIHQITLRLIDARKINADININGITIFGMLMTPWRWLAHQNFHLVVVEHSERFGMHKHIQD